MEGDVLLKLLSNVGIPAALCFYTLFEVNKNLKKLADSIDRQTDENDKRLDKLESSVSELKFRVENLSRGDLNERR